MPLAQGPQRQYQVAAAALTVDWAASGKGPIDLPVWATIFRPQTSAKFSFLVTDIKMAN
jgi:hypothetical protein